MLIDMSMASSLPKNKEDAILLQKNLRNKIFIKNDFSKLETIAGVDVSYDIKNNISRAVIVSMNFKNLTVLSSIIAYEPTTFPYIPGLLSFREIPVILKALNEIEQPPDILMVDGQGIAHPRRLGIAAHLGILTNIPAIGVAKSRLTGCYQEPGLLKGEQSLLLSGKERIGTVLRSKNNIKPLFISPGHRIDHETAVAITLKCLTRYRLPEPTRLADKLSKNCPPYTGQNILHFSN
jgi:deoxyribonuclease V